MKQPVQKKYIRPDTFDESLLQKLSLNDKENSASSSSQKQTIAAFQEAVKTARFLAIAKVAPKDRLAARRPGCKRCGRHSHITACCKKAETTVDLPTPELPTLTLPGTMEVSA